MLTVIAAGMLCTLPIEEPIYDARQFRQIMQSLHAPIRDVTFLYEGKFLGLPAGVSAENAMEGGNPSRAILIQSYQGAYAVRSDGASYYDIFATNYRDGVVDSARQTAANIHDKKQYVSRLPDKRNEPPNDQGGGPGTMDTTGSPERINLLYFFFALQDYTARHFRHLGWETVAGHRCAMVQFDAIYGDSRPENERPLLTFWVDLQRGGHVLLVEDRDPQEGLRMRSVAIHLAEVDCAGDSLWFPVEGRCEIFANLGGRQPTAPAGVELYSVVAETIRFNQDLADAAFVVDRPFPGTAGLDPLRKSFRVPIPRNDPQGIKDRLAAELARANKNEKSPEIRVERTAAGSSGWIQPALIGIGVGSLLAGVWLWRRTPR